MLRGKRIEKNQRDINMQVNLLINKVNELIAKQERFERGIKSETSMLEWKINKVYEVAYKNNKLIQQDRNVVIKQREKRHNAKNPNNPFINNSTNKVPSTIKIKNKLYTTSELSKMFNVSRVTINIRINKLIKILGKDIQQYFYKINNGYENGDKRGKKWMVTPKGLEKLAESFEVEVEKWN